MERFARLLNLRQFALANQPLFVGQPASRPETTQMILRMLVRAPYSGGLCLSTKLAWVRPLIEQSDSYQKAKIKIQHPFTYVTIRHGLVSSVADDFWHVDGFSTRYNHPPEANYIFTSGGHPTEYLNQPFYFPFDFNPLKHNVHCFFQRRAKSTQIVQMEPETLYFVDPYVIHRRPPSSTGTARTFVRITFTPIEIMDKNNTRNPLIKTPHYTLDGVKEFRDLLRDYDMELKGAGPMPLHIGYQTRG